ncbi:conjugal transfer protein TraH, partial [Escherichia coli]|nr:conjugal transfer protein TraH [Escherichia coli]
FSGNKELKEFVMTLTGSLVFGANGEITPLAPKTTDQSIIRALMEGGTARIYHCNDSDKCLKVVADSSVTISPERALKGQILDMLTSIKSKARDDVPLTEKEKGLISGTHVPLLTYLVDPQMLGVDNSLVYSLADYVGYDIMLQYLQELMSGARAMLAVGNYPEATMEQINSNFTQANQLLASLQSRVQVQTDALLVVDQQMRYMRQQVSARMLTRYQDNYRFGGGQ